MLLEYLKKMLTVWTCHPRKLDEDQDDKKENDNSYTQTGGWMTITKAASILSWNNTDSNLAQYQHDITLSM